MALDFWSKVLPPPPIPDEAMARIIAEGAASRTPEELERWAREEAANAAADAAMERWRERYGSDADEYEEDEREQTLDEVLADAAEKLAASRELRRIHDLRHGRIPPDEPGTW